MPLEVIKATVGQHKVLIALSHIVAAYESHDGRVWIVTDCDHGPEYRAPEMDDHSPFFPKLIRIDNSFGWLKNRVTIVGGEE